MKKRILNLMILWLVFTVCGFAQPGLVGYWSFDNISDGFARDHTEFANSATIFEGLNIQGVKGTAMELNGSNSFARITYKGLKTPEVISRLGEGSISVWFKVEHIPLDHGIAPILYYGSSAMCDFFDAANQGLIIEVGHSPIYPGNRNLFFTIWKDGCTYPSFCFDTNSPISLNEWYHFVAVVGNDFNTGYLNGKELESRNYNFGDKTNSQFFADAIAHEEFWLGKGHWDRTEQYFDGAIDELKIFNRALNKDEVIQLFNEGDLSQNNNAWQQTITNTIPTVYPNPVSEKMYVNLSNLNFPVIKISITDLNGNVVMTHLTKNCGNSIDLGNIPNGTYSVSFFGEQKIFRKKLIVLK